MSLAICSLASGSSGNCYAVLGGDGFVLVDAGISGRQIKLGLKNIGLSLEEVSAIMVTHGHSDHIKGIPYLLKHTGAQIYASEGSFKEMNLEGDLGGRKKRFCPGESLSIGDICVNTFPVSHDALEPAGFSFLKGGCQLSIITDTGAVTPCVLEQMRGADILVLESNYDESMLRMGRYPWFLKQRIGGREGHLSNEAAAMALAKVLEEEKDRQIAGKRIVLLAHLSRENNFPEMALATVNNMLEERGLISADTEIRILPRCEQSPLYRL